MRAFTLTYDVCAHEVDVVDMLKACEARCFAAYTHCYCYDSSRGERARVVVAVARGSKDNVWGKCRSYAVLSPRPNTPPMRVMPAEGHVEIKSAYRRSLYATQRYVCKMRRCAAGACVAKPAVRSCN